MIRTIVVMLALSTGHIVDTHTYTDSNRRPSAPASVQQIQEDDPHWDCRTMGNHVCGVLGQDNVWYLAHYGENGIVDWIQPR